MRLAIVIVVYCLIAFGAYFLGFAKGYNQRDRDNGTN
jgi:hypothetical protein